MRTFLSVVILMAGFSAEAHAFNWDGEYSGACEGGTKYECELILKDVGRGRIKANLTVTELGGARKVNCQLHGMFRQSGDSLHGDFGPSVPNLVFSPASSGVNLHGTAGKAPNCKAQMDGEFYIMGE